MKNLLIVDDDLTFSEVLKDSLIKRGIEVIIAHNVPDALKVVKTADPKFVLTDLKMPGASGLELISEVLKINPGTLIVVLTGYASINSAVEAIKLGAVHYLSKPVSADEIIAAFNRLEGNAGIIIDESTTLNRNEWALIRTSLVRNNNNISATARELGLHRRTLQRKLDKLPK